MQISIRHPENDDEKLFLTMSKASVTLHTPWVKPPLTHDEYVAYVKRSKEPNHRSFMVLDSQDDIIGVFNVSEIVRGAFQSAYLGFYGSAKYAGTGLMSMGLKQVLNAVFDELKLHRIEANIQPDNIRSIKFVQKNGFRKEGYSLRYLNIADEWKDHERWAITVEDRDVKHPK